TSRTTLRSVCRWDNYWRLLCRGDAEMKARALTDSALHPDTATVGIHDMLCDGKAQAGAAGLAGTGGIHTIKAFETALQIGLRHSDACIGNGENHGVIFRAGLHVDSSAW